MIAKIAITNFRSIRDKVELSIIKSSISGHPSNLVKVSKGFQLLKSTVIYGPNASGKSTVLLALKAIKTLVASSSRNRTNQLIKQYEPFKLDKSKENAPVVFEISFFLKKVLFEFAFSFNRYSILSEELHFYPKGVRSLLYQRKRGREIKYGEYFKGGKKIVEELLQDNQLFISKAGENNPVSLKDPYLFFIEQLEVFPFIDTYEESNLNRLFVKRLAEDGNSRFSRLFNRLICALDTGIKSISAIELDWKKFRLDPKLPDEVKEKLLEDFKYDIKTVHPVFKDQQPDGEVSFRLREESKGTQSLFVVAGIILDTLLKGNVLVIDEFESNLHPEITRYLIRLFHNPATNPYNAQLIFATHDVSQLSGDTFRRDQIWFTEKNEYGVTQLYNCADIRGIRLQTPLDKWYSAGKFGATPLINDTDFLIEMQQNEPAV